jgi:AcrR family transcriptional regulator
MDVEDRTIGLEMTYIAVHNPRFRRRVQEYSAKMDSYLKDLFAETPRAFNLSAEDAALLAGSIWHGLVVTSYYYEGFDLSRARVLFRESLLTLAGLGGEQSELVDERSGNSSVSLRRAPAASMSPSSLNRGDLLKGILGEDNSDRRIVILRALWRLMLEKGYASTTLTDVATKASLSPSHLAYYFRNKEAILLTLYDALTDGIFAITAHRDQPPIDQIELLAGHVFLEPVMDIRDRTIVLELMGIAVHNPLLRERTSQNTKLIIDYFRELFAKSPGVLNLSAEDAAVLAASIWTGMLTNSYFHKGFDWSRARVLFRQSLLMLAGSTDQQFSWPAQHTRTRERSHPIAPKTRARAQQPRRNIGSQRTHTM